MLSSAKHVAPSLSKQGLELDRRSRKALTDRPIRSGPEGASSCQNTRAHHFRRQQDSDSHRRWIAFS